MAKLKLKFRDISRMTKKYPYTRHLPRTQLVSDKEFELEVMSVDVSNLEEVVVEWSTSFGGIPNVTATIVMKAGATAYGTGTVAEKEQATALANSMANVNIWVKSASTKNCTIAFSDVFTGTLNIQAIRFT